MQRFLEPETLARVEQLRPIAADAGCSLAELALAWCLRQPNVASVIVGATRPEQLEENVGALQISLSEDALAAIDAIFPP